MTTDLLRHIGFTLAAGVDSTRNELEKLIRQDSSDSSINTTFVRYRKALKYYHEFCEEEEILRNEQITQ